MSMPGMDALLPARAARDTGGGCQAAPTAARRPPHARERKPTVTELPDLSLDAVSAPSGAVPASSSRPRGSARGHGHDRRRSGAGTRPWGMVHGGVTPRRWRARAASVPRPPSAEGRAVRRRALQPHGLHPRPHHGARCTRAPRPSTRGGTGQLWHCDITRDDGKLVAQGQPCGCRTSRGLRSSGAVAQEQELVRTRGRHEVRSRGGSSRAAAMVRGSPPAVTTGATRGRARRPGRRGTGRASSCGPPSQSTERTPARRDRQRRSPSPRRSRRRPESAAEGRSVASVDRCQVGHDDSGRAVASLKAGAAGRGRRSGIRIGERVVGIPGAPARRRCCLGGTTRAGRIPRRGRSRLRPSARPARAERVRRVAVRPVGEDGGAAGDVARPSPWTTMFASINGRPRRAVREPRRGVGGSSPFRRVGQAARSKRPSGLVPGFDPLRAMEAELASPGPRSAATGSSRKPS